MDVLQERNGAATIWRLSLRLEKLFDAHKPAAVQKPTPQTNTNPRNDQDVLENFLFYWPGHVLKIQHALFHLLENTPRIASWREQRNVRILDVACGPATASVAFADALSQLLRRSPLAGGPACRLDYHLLDVTKACPELGERLLQAYHKMGADSTNLGAAVELGAIQNIVAPLCSGLDLFLKQADASGHAVDIVLVCNALASLICPVHAPSAEWTKHDFARFRSESFQRLIDFRSHIARLASHTATREAMVLVLQEQRHFDLLSLTSPGPQAPVFRPWMWQQGYRPDKPRRTFGIPYGFWCTGRDLRFDGFERMWDGDEEPMPSMPERPSVDWSAFRMRR